MHKMLTIMLQYVIVSSCVWMTTKLLMCENMTHKIMLNLQIIYHGNMSKMMTTVSQCVIETSCVGL